MPRTELTLHLVSRQDPGDPRPQVAVEVARLRLNPEEAARMAAAMRAAASLFGEEEVVGLTLSFTPREEEGWRPSVGADVEHVPAA